MILNDAGDIVNEMWLAIPEHFQNVVIDEHIIMPNHVHGIICVGAADLRALRRPLQNHNRSKMILSMVIHGFKSSAARRIHNKLNNHLHVWQRSYHDHIIRNERSLRKIRRYIRNNPLLWKYDRGKIH
ncbi:MAG: transposase [Candidatus Omnitrophota bacterium]